MNTVLTICLALMVMAPVCSIAQGAPRAEVPSSLPAAPLPQQATPALSNPPAPAPQNGASQPAAGPGLTTLSLNDAQLLALKNNPQISFARLTALASRQVTREFRSNL